MKARNNDHTESGAMLFYRLSFRSIVYLYIRKCPSLKICPKILITRSRIRTYVLTIQSRTLYECVAFTGANKHAGGPETHDQHHQLARRDSAASSWLVCHNELRACLLATTNKHNQHDQHSWNSSTWTPTSTEKSQNPKAKTQLYMAVARSKNSPY